MGKEKKTAVDAAQKKGPVDIKKYNIHEWAKGIVIDGVKYVDEGGGELKSITIKRRGNVSSYFSPNTEISLDEGRLLGATFIYTGDPLDLLEALSITIVDHERNAVYDFSKLETVEGLHKFSVREIFAIIAAFLDPDNRI